MRDLHFLLLRYFWPLNSSAYSCLMSPFRLSSLSFHPSTFRFVPDLVLCHMPTPRVYFPFLSAFNALSLTKIEKFLGGFSLIAPYDFLLLAISFELLTFWLSLFLRYAAFRRPSDSPLVAMRGWGRFFCFLSVPPPALSDPLTMNGEAYYVFLCLAPRRLCPFFLSCFETQAPLFFSSAAIICSVFLCPLSRFFFPCSREGPRRFYSLFLRGLRRSKFLFGNLWDALSFFFPLLPSQREGVFYLFR